MNCMFPELNRPQYPSSPEVLLSALAWSVIPRAPAYKNTGLIYLRKSSRAHRDVKIEQTMPVGDSLESFRCSLQANGLRSANGELPIAAAKAAADALLGVQPLKGVGVASSAIGLCGALLQDPVGGLATNGPPNFAHLLNTMHALGGSEGESAAERWFKVGQHFASTPRLKALEAALASTTLAPFLPNRGLPHEPIQQSQDPIRIPDWWRRDVIEPGIGTPFFWFRTAWDRLCSDEWYEVLPPRRWAGWAVCVLRNAIGFTFLWEANFFLELARGVKDHARDPASVARWALAPTKPLVPYQRGGVAQMDVKPSIERLLTQGLACRHALIDATAKLVTLPGSLAELVRVLRTTCRDGNPDPIGAALGGDGYKGGLSNLIETVRYSLLSRGAPNSPDQHALLKVVSRNFTHVSPGPEWIVVMSALASAHRTSIVRLGDVRRSLEALGFKPRIDFLLRELERAGLCGSASDGDEGIEINLGFGEH